MTADTLSAEPMTDAEVDELYDEIGQLSASRWLEIKKQLATPELLALGEAAVAYERRKADTDAAWEPSELQSAAAFESYAERAFTEAARAYAASVASIPTNTGVE